MYPICNCKGCQNIGTIKISLNRRGNRASYLCEHHATELERYSTENDEKLGTSKAHGYTFGVELETSYSDLKARAEIVANGYIPTSDCTVDVEYKSPIMYGLNSLSKQTVTYQRLIDEGHLEIGYGCGTHFHVGHVEKINLFNIAKIRKYYTEIFLPVTRLMMENPLETEMIFGRYFTGYAEEIDEYTDPDKHENWINLQHSKTLEWRLVKYVTGKQFMNAAKLCYAFTETIVNNFLKHYNDRLSESQLNRYGSLDAYRKHKARVTAGKLCKLYSKAAGI